MTAQHAEQLAYLKNDRRYWYDQYEQLGEMQAYEAQARALTRLGDAQARLDAYVLDHAPNLITML